jgi:hypothetical protein
MSIASFDKTRVFARFSYDNTGLELVAFESPPPWLGDVGEFQKPTPSLIIPSGYLT